jgi:dihydropteroate synthase
MFKLPAKAIMGIINATPDSFFAGSRQPSFEQAIQKAALFLQQGASIIDIGGQSTRPGANMVSEKEEIDRVLPVIEGILKAFPTAIISIDTYRAEVAKQAILNGAQIVNDISCGSFDPAILEIVAYHKVKYIGMHITGNLETMHQVVKRENVIASIISYFYLKKQAFELVGIQDWIIDPGFGFGKTVEENFQIVKALKQFKELDLPILLGVSRKSSIYKTLNITQNEALNGTTIVNTVGLINGADIIRVHDVKEAKEIIDLLPMLT